MHPTQKPVELVKYLIEKSTDVGDVVLDPFMGSGTTGVAAVALDRDFVGYEVDERYYNIAKEVLDGCVRSVG
jgi:DNA modification methylase